jgi:PST family polysaccharide transporter
VSILHNIKWAAFSQLARIGSQIASVTLLARLLSPSDYGVLAIAAIFTNFAMLFRDFGTGSALIQRETLTEGLKASVFWLNMALGGLICLTLMAASPAVAHFYDAPTLVPVLCLMALSFPVACSSIVHQSLLERASQFKRIAAVESVAVVLALLAAVGAALAGWGVYALVAQTLVAATVQGAMLWAMSDWRPAPRPRWDGLREISGYSGNVSAFQFVNYFARNADSFIIGKVLGSAVLGLYSVAYRLMLFPVQNISHVVARAVFPLLTQAHQQGGRAQMAEVYLRSLGVITFGTAPVMAALWFFREPTVAVVFGAKWAGAEVLLAWLAPTGFIQSVLSTSGSAFLATGQAGLMLRYGVIGSVLQVASFAAGIHFGVVGLTQAYLIATVLNLLLTMAAVLRLLETGPAPLLRAIGYQVLAALAAGVLVWGGDRWIFGHAAAVGRTGLWRLAAQYALFAACYLGLMAVLAPQKMASVKAMFRGKLSRAS